MNLTFLYGSYSFDNDFFFFTIYSITKKKFTVQFT
jgi:hypothetical protein